MSGRTVTTSVQAGLDWSWFFPTFYSNCLLIRETKGRVRGVTRSREVDLGMLLRQFLSPFPGAWGWRRPWVRL